MHIKKYFEKKKTQLAKKIQNSLSFLKLHYISLKKRGVSLMQFIRKVTLPCRGLSSLKMHKKLLGHKFHSPCGFYTFLKVSNMI